MTKEEVREILATWRLEGEDASDPLIASALAEAQRDPELAEWFAREQEFDRHFAEALARAPRPEGLRAKLLASQEVASNRRWRRSRRGAWLAAAVLVLLVVFSSWQGLLQPAASLADFRSEMVSFVRLTPPLELETSQLARIESWLAREGAPGPGTVAPGLAALEPTGCRILSFRGHKVTLICFRRSGAQLVHLLVVDRQTLSRLGNEPTFAREGAWSTAMWSKGDWVYLLTTRGERALLEPYLTAANASPIARNSRK